MVTLLVQGPHLENYWSSSVGFEGNQRKYLEGFLRSSVVNNPPANAGASASIPDQEDPLEKKIAAHPSILAWKIPWTEEPGGLQPFRHHVIGLTDAFLNIPIHVGFPDGSVVKNPSVDARDEGSVPGSGRSPGGGNGNPLQYCYLENPTDRGDWQAPVHKIAKSWTQLSD